MYNISSEFYYLLGNNTSNVIRVEESVRSILSKYSLSVGAVSRIHLRVDYTFQCDNNDIETRRRSTRSGRRGANPTIMRVRRGHNTRLVYSCTSKNIKNWPRWLCARRTSVVSGSEKNGTFQNGGLSRLVNRRDGEPFPGTRVFGHRKKKKN